MRIIVPAADLAQICKLCDAGADDIYIGFFDEMWSRKFGVFSELNRMSSFGAKANIASELVSEAIFITHSKGRKLYITLNSPAYSLAEIQTVLELIDRYQMWVCDGFIVSDISMIEALTGRGYHIKLSTMAGAYNDKIVSFYKKIGVHDIILPRDVPIDAMERIVNKHSDVNFEAFLMRNGCRYSDSNCLAFHDRKYGAICSWLDRYGGTFNHNTNTLKYEELKEAYSNNHLFKYALLKKACGLCSIPKLCDIGIKSVKIVGRADNSVSIIDDIRNVKTIINNGKMTLTGNFFGSCLYGLNCYYKQNLQ